MNKNKEEHGKVLVNVLPILIAIMLVLLVIYFSVYGFNNKENYKIFKEECHNESQVIGIEQTSTESKNCSITITHMGQFKYCASSNDLKNYPCNSNYCRFWNDQDSIEIKKENYTETWTNEKPIIKYNEFCEKKEIDNICITNINQYKWGKSQLISPQFKDGCYYLYNKDITKEWLDGNCLGCIAFDTNKKLCLQYAEKTESSEYKCGDYEVELK